MLLLFGQGCGQPMQQMREGLMHGVCMWMRLSQNETAFFCVCKKIGQVLTSLSQNLPVSLIFCILGNQVKIFQR